MPDLVGNPNWLFPHAKAHIFFLFFFSYFMEGGGGGGG